MPNDFSAAGAASIDLGSAAAAERGIIHCHLGQLYAAVVIEAGRKMAPFPTLTQRNVLCVCRGMQMWLRYTNVFFSTNMAAGVQAREF